MPDFKQRLKRLPPEYYQEFAWVHWTLTIEGRRVGWLDARFYHKFRELLTHVAFRYRILLYEGTIPVEKLAEIFQSYRDYAKDSAQHSL